ncbi:phospholipid phosphatase 2-like [Limulus polyphemus]|uniref:Phospholipid phosphatase 2-like n=1 Tax=Limulus polyphemus TaxID=6850 RepID=A0ABM1BQV6_LIMPO|nr:phospholipid phosphatase 2-like [Limulus polyphemus]
MAVRETYSNVSTVRRIVDNLMWMSALLFVCLAITGILRPKRIGFACNDISIQHPFVGDTISEGVLLCSLLFGSALTIFIVEAIHHYPISKNLNQQCYNHWLMVLGDFLLGFVYVFFVTELLKAVVGELRPHFLASCQPDWSKINCSEGFVIEYNCTRREQYRLENIDIYKSFPSGHSSLSLYSFVFISLYAQVRLQWTSKSHVLKLVLQLVFLSWALVCSLTRISDRRHFWWDVLVGCLIGIIGGILTVRCFLRNSLFCMVKVVAGDESASSTKKDN